MSAPKTDPTTDCPPCEKCGLPCAVPGSRLEGRNLGGNPRSLACQACGHAWIEGSVARVLQAWKAEIAYADREDPEDAKPRKRFNGAAHMKKILDEITTLRALVELQREVIAAADAMRDLVGTGADEAHAYDAAREITR